MTTQEQSKKYNPRGFNDFKELFEQIAKKENIKWVCIGRDYDDPRRYYTVIQTESDFYERTLRYISDTAYKRMIQKNKTDNYVNEDWDEINTEEYEYSEYLDDKIKEFLTAKGFKFKGEYSDEGLSEVWEAKTRNEYYSKNEGV